MFGSQAAIHWKQYTVNPNSKLLHSKFKLTYKYNRCDKQNELFR